MLQRQAEWSLNIPGNYCCPAPAHLLSSHGIASIKMQVGQRHSRIMLYGSREAAVLHDGLIHDYHVLLTTQGFMTLGNLGPQLLVVVLWQLLDSLVELKSLHSQSVSVSAPVVP